jgi:ribonuclease BN (tRNA processing enzyme)
MPGLERLHAREAFNALDAVAAAAAANVKKLVLTHFHFDSTDRELDDLREGLGYDHPFEIELAREGSTLWL